MFGQPLQYISYLSHPWVVKTSSEIASALHPSDRRTKEMKLKDSINGCAVQLAVFEFLQQSGESVEHAPQDRKEYDIIINRISSTFYVDIKAIFKPDARYFSQTAWERINVPHLGHRVHYMCFDCKSEVAVYKGWCTDRDFVPSSFNDGAYVYSDILSTSELK